MSFGLIAGLALVFLFAGGNILLHARAKRMARQRAGEGFNDFAAFFVNKNVPHEVLLNTYNYFSEWNAVAGELFPLRPDDNISDVYGCVDEDLEDAVSEILKKSGRRRFAPGAGGEPHAPLETVEDVALYVAAAPFDREVER